jgi:hypothetical protein
MTAMHVVEVQQLASKKVIPAELLHQAPSLCSGERIAD